MENGDRHRLACAAGAGTVGKRALEAPMSSISLVQRPGAPTKETLHGSMGLVHIIDDDEPLRQSLGSLIRSVGYEARLHESTTRFLACKREPVPSCLLLDVRLPGANGLDFQATLRRLGISHPVVLMTGFGDVQMSVRGIKAGAVNFLTKPISNEDLIESIAEAIAHDRDRSATEALAAGLRERCESLSSREKQIFSLVVAGQMNKQIAGKLGLSEITIKIHRASVMRKMEARTLADLVKMARRLGGYEGEQEFGRISPIRGV